MIIRKRIFSVLMCLMLVLRRIMITQARKIISMALVLLVCVPFVPNVSLAVTNYTVTLESSAETVSKNERFTVNVVLNGDAGEIAPASASATLNYNGAMYLSGNSSLAFGQAENSGEKCVAGYSNNVYGRFDSDGKLTIASFTFKASSDNVILSLSEASATEQGATETAIVSLPTESTTIKVITSVNTITSIKNEQDLRDFAQSVNAGIDYTGETVLLENDITLTDKWTVPVGSYTGYDTASQIPFTGVFDGNGHVIKGLDIEYEINENLSSRWDVFDTVGLFGYVRNGEIRDLEVQGRIDVSSVSAIDYSNRDVISSAGGPYVGSVAARVEDTVISGCVSDMEICVTVSSGLGGITGCSINSTVKDCSNNGNITVTRKSDATGGITGYCSCESGKTVDIRQCANYGNITIQYYEVHNTGSHEGTSYDLIETAAYGGAGGLVGSAIHYNASNSIVISDSTNKGNVTGQARYLGGLVGLAGPGTGNTNAVYIYVSDCYNIGQIRNTDGFSTSQSKDAYVSVGGLIGKAEEHNTLENCYNTGAVSTGGGYSHASELVSWESSTGISSATLTNCYQSTNTITVDALNGDPSSDKWKSDTNGLNGGNPILYWEKGADSEDTHIVTFDPGEVKADVKVFRDAATSDQIEASSDGTYSLPAGTYYYKAEKEGYLPETGSFTVTVKDLTVPVVMKQ